MTNDYEHLLISLAFIIVVVLGKEGTGLYPHCVGDGRGQEEVHRALGLSVGG